MLTRNQGCRRNHETQSCQEWGFGAACGTRFEACLGVERLYQRCWGSDSVRWHVALPWCPKQLSLSVMPPVVGLPQRTWRDFPENHVRMCGGLVCTEVSPRTWAWGVEKASGREPTRVERPWVRGQSERAGGCAGPWPPVYQGPTVLLVNLGEGCGEVPSFSLTSRLPDTFRH